MGGAARRKPFRTYIGVVSDHGFAKTDAQLNLFPAFRGAKLFTAEKEKIVSWRAIPWVSSASAAIMLKDPRDAATLTQVRELLSRLSSDPQNRTDPILEA